MDSDPTLKDRFLRLVAYYGSLGLASRRSTALRRVVHGWLEDPAFRAEYEEAVEGFRDSIREMLVDKAHAGDAATIRFLAQAEMPEKYGPAAKAHQAKSQPEVIWRGVD